MKIAAAQIKPVENNTPANIEKHLQQLDQAIAQDVKLIAFPEMSLTGYEREGAAQLAFSEDDSRLAVFKHKARHHGIYILAGAPIAINSALHIGTFIFSPDGGVAVYTKQFLHDGEEQYFTPSNHYNPLIALQQEQIAVAICADINNPAHPAQAAGRGSSLYIAGIFYTPNGIAEAHSQLSNYAEKHAMHVLMANFAGSSYHMKAAGQSAFWDNKGKVIATLNSDEEGLLVVDI